MCSSASLRPKARNSRLQQRRDRRLADPAEAERGHGDAELAGGEIGLEVIEHAQRQAGGAAALLGHGSRCGSRRTLTSANSAATKKAFAGQQQNDGDRVEHG